MAVYGGSSGSIWVVVVVAAADKKQKVKTAHAQPNLIKPTMHNRLSNL